MQLPWELTTVPKHRLLRRGRKLNGVHAVAMRRQLAWAEEFAQAGDLASALDALGDAGALAQELGRDLDGAGIAGL
jgi:hypothetical protein